MPNRRGDTLQSVERAITILKLFSRDKPDWGVSELGREMHLHKSIVSRLLKTLEQGGLLSRHPDTERYRLSVNLIGLAAQVVSLLDVREVSRPWLRQLAEACQETVNLSVLEAGRVVNIEQSLPPSREVKSTGWVGQSMPPHATAAGKALMAYLPPVELEQILRQELEALTARTIVNPADLRQELARVRDQRYAVAHEELETGLNAVATVVWDHRGTAVASVNIAGPAYRLTPKMFPKLAAQLNEVSDKISEQLGFRRLEAGR
jgi:IclR family transcriptional regulator, KDG regulon repressor